MNMYMDECTNSINVWSISAYNISSYIRKNGKFACVIDVMALVMDREPRCLVQTLKYMLDTYPCRHSQLIFKNGFFCPDISFQFFSNNFKILRCTNTNFRS